MPIQPREASIADGLTETEVRNSIEYWKQKTENEIAKIRDTTYIDPDDPSFNEAQYVAGAIRRQNKNANKMIKLLQERLDELIVQK